MMFDSLSLSYYFFKKMDATLVRSCETILAVSQPAMSHQIEYPMQRGDEIPRSVAGGFGSLFSRFQSGLDRV